MIFEAMLIGGVLPGAVVVTLLAALWWKRRTPTTPTNPTTPTTPTTPGASGTLPLWAAPLCVPLAMLPAEFLVRGGWPPLWPAAGADRLIHAAAAAGIVGALEHFLGSRRWAAAALRVGGAALAVWLVLGVRVPDFWTPVQAVLWIGGYAAVIAGVSTLVNRAAGAERGPAVTAAVFVSTLGTAPVLLHAGMAYPAQLSGGITACAGGALLVAMVIPGFTLSGGGVTGVVTVSGVLLLAGHYYAPDDIPLSQTLCLSVAPLSALVVLVPAVARAAGWTRCALAAVLCVVPVAIGAVLAIAGARSEAGGYESGL